MGNSINQEELKELVSITSETLEISHPSIIEKDYYVTRIIHALSDVENDYFQLIFTGGTCLAKAHKIVKRMSEDIDFKIQTKGITENFSKNHLLKELKKFRSQIISVLTLPDLAIGETVFRNEGQYQRIELNYPALFPGNQTLRPHLQLELTLSNVHLPTKILTIKSIIEEVMEKITLFPTSLVSCISVDETVIEKWVGLTRRIIAIERKYHDDDTTLIRHVYDLHAIKNADRINDNFFSLGKTIVNSDAKQFKNKHPEYFNDPSSEIRHSLEILKNKSIWKTRYHNFINSMVYDRAGIPNYESVIHTLENISQNILTNLN